MMQWVWPYLDDLDFRYGMLYGLVRLAGKNVVELNCGKTHLHWYHKDMVSFKANDIIELSDESWFYNMTDDKFVDEEVFVCDVLCCFGIGGYEYSQSQYESPTITQSIINVANRCKPETIVLENIQKYEDIVKRISQETGYKVVRRIAYECGDDYVHKRVLCILKKV